MLDPVSQFFVIVQDEVLEIPDRIYYPEENVHNLSPFNPLHKEILNCFYTRHHNGFVRERCLREIVTSEYVWVVPYVVKLIGEYVIEILQVIKDNLVRMNLAMYGEFLTKNQKFYQLTKQRVASYWNCYYRWQHPNKERYVGFQILRYLDEYR
ncbi:MAG: hypothetical protein H6633_20325 [Anaerolineales bacterium]|nr:hypothetical protein [Anaerolineales bacterium]